MIPALERFAGNPIVTPSQIPFITASGAFNPGATIDRATGKVVLLVRVFEAEEKRSSLGLALSTDGEHIDEIWSRPAVERDATYEELGVEDARITYLEEDEIYAITYTGYSSAGPRVCLITTDNLLAPERYRRHGPRLSGENKNCVIFPRRIDGSYVILHRPMPKIELIKVKALEDLWPAQGVPLIGPRPDSWRSARVGAGAPPIETDLGWLFPFHGATEIEKGNVYSMGWCVLDPATPEKVLYVSEEPALKPEAGYEIEMNPIPQVDMANFITGVRVVFPQGLVQVGEDLLLYYGAGDVNVGGARVNKSALVNALRTEIQFGRTAPPL